jgi:predicted MFS family arabinose efflux permease
VVPALAPFAIRSFRFQWPADLAASWAFEMEGIILGWFVLVETGSVLALAVFGSLQFLGTLISPLYGMAGDRIGYRNLLLVMRAVYFVVAGILAVLFVTGAATATAVFVLAMIVGLVRPSDITMRNLLVGETMPASLLMRAMGLSRTTADSARVAGALTGAAVVAALGSGEAYLVACGIYLVSFSLTIGVGIRRVRVVETPPAASVFATLREGFAYVWANPVLRAAMFLAFMMNLVGYPISGALLAHVAKDIYGMDQSGLGWLIASFSGGALLGSIALSVLGGRVPPARAMLVGATLWFVLDLVFAFITTPQWGEVFLFLAGVAQSFCMIPMAVILLRIASPEFRGRVMGVRMLCVYGLPVGLLAAGPLIERWGFAFTAAGYSLLGIACVAWIVVTWRHQLWRKDAAVNV